MCAFFVIFFPPHGFARTFSDTPLVFLWYKRMELPGQRTKLRIKVLFQIKGAA